MMEHLRFSDEVRAALAENRPVVALESTIISHGMPWPQNYETALRVEDVVRQTGAVPATMAIMDGAYCAGLSPGDLEGFARAGSAVAKVSRRDIPTIMHRRQMGATTVAATMILAQAAGIRIFATGGIGGVHREAERTMDISADLQELAQTDVAVVCAGAKSILDIGLTLEYLETHGVPVWGFQTDEFPAFYTPHSGFGVDCRVDTPAEIAGMLRAKWALGLRGGVVIGNPIPAQYAPDGEMIQRATETALLEAAQAHIKGKAITPYLLHRIEQLTAGKSLAANIELVCHNARLAGLIAVS